MPFNSKESRFTATKMVSGNDDWYVRCRIHGEFENKEGRCLMCDEDSAPVEVFYEEVE